MESTPSLVHLDREQILTLAHPLRHRLLSALRMLGPSTATTLAAALNTNTGKTSYHLRKLAAAGLVIEDDDRGNARDRWWRAAHDVSSWSPSAFADDPDAASAADWLLGQAAGIYADRIGRWTRTRRDWSGDWGAAADMSDLRLRLRPERLRALNDELLAVVNRYLEDQDPVDDSEAADCSLIVAGFPDTGDLP